MNDFPYINRAIYRTMVFSAITFAIGAGMIHRHAQKQRKRK